jgi:hypothetical protein
MRGIQPPVNSKINGPDGIEYMIGKEYMSKIEHVLRVFLVDGADSPREADKGEGRVDVEGELSSVAACAGEKGNEAVNSSDLVEHRKEDNQSGASLEIEKTKHRSKRPRPELLLKSKFHGGHM